MEIAASGTPIQPLLIGDSAEAMRISQRLREREFWCPRFVRRQYRRARRDCAFRCLPRTSERHSASDANIARVGSGMTQLHVETLDRVPIWFYCTAGRCIAAFGAVWRDQLAQQFRLHLVDFADMA